MANGFDDCEACLSQPVTEEMAAFLAIHNNPSKTIDGNVVVNSYEWLRALVAVPCDKCYRNYTDTQFTSKIFRDFISLNDEKKMDKVCGGRRGYSHPQSDLVYQFMSYSLKPLNVNMLQHLRMRWRYSWRLDDLLEDYRLAKKHEDNKNYDPDNQALIILRSCEV